MPKARKRRRKGGRVTKIRCLDCGVISPKFAWGKNMSCPECGCGRGKIRTH